MDFYAASCNPPRRAKRPRSDSSSSSSSNPDDGAYDPPPPKRRGRKPGTLSRAAREAQRKINHSLIEKARRTKINDALATLRQLVPIEYKRPIDTPDDSDDEELDTNSGKPKPKSSAQKEFKLEILVRTVAYLQDLTQKVCQLEQNGCPSCGEPISNTNDHRQPTRTASNPAEPRTECPPSSPPSLPPISTWLPSSVLLTPSQSPAFGPVTTAAPVRPPAPNLPTPPASATFSPSTVGFPMPPTLSLPSPTTSPLTQLQPRFSGFTPRSNPKKSPLSSPVYTPDDETAASLLLRISTSTSSYSSAQPSLTARHRDISQRSALTPSRLLGLTHSEER